jgi:hypothetical protein
MLTFGVVCKIGNPKVVSVWFPVYFSSSVSYIVLVLLITHIGLVSKKRVAKWFYL